MYISVLYTGNITIVLNAMSENITVKRLCFSYLIYFTDYGSKVLLKNQIVAKNCKNNDCLSKFP